MRIYLDHNATSPPRDEVVEAVLRAMRENWGNPSSTHAEGARARAAVDRAREQVAHCLRTRPHSVYFTAGATEANNTVLRSLPPESAPDRRRIVTSSVEHPSVMEPCARIEAAGTPVSHLPVDSEGQIDPAALEEAIDDRTALVSIIWANNETGVIQPIEELAQIVRARGALFHVDATQAVGKWPVDLSSLPIDYLSCSAHKFNGPKGVGCLVVSERAPLRPLLRGGPQERRWRGGTENVAGIVGFGVACERARHDLPEHMRRLEVLRDRLWRGIEKDVPDVRRNGSIRSVLPNTLNVEFRGAAGDVLVQALDIEGVSVSAGAACHSGSISPSHVLVAMGRTPEQARGCLRFSVGLGVDEAQIDRTLELLRRLVPRAREAVGA